MDGGAVSGRLVVNTIMVASACNSLPSLALTFHFGPDYFISWWRFAIELTGQSRDRGGISLHEYESFTHRRCAAVGIMMKFQCAIAFSRIDFSPQLLTAEDEATSVRLLATRSRAARQEVTRQAQL